MDREFWQSRWQQGKIGFHQGSVNPYLARFWGRLGIDGKQVFVPFCGKSRDMLWLRDQGHAVLGVEIIPQAAEAFFTEYALDVKVKTWEGFQIWMSQGIDIYCGDFFMLECATLAGVAATYDRAALIAMPPSLRLRYAQHLRIVLPDTTKILLVAVAYPQHEMEGPPFAVEEEEIRRLYEPAFHVRLIHSEDVLEANPKFKEKGLSRLQEQVYLMDRRRKS